MNEYIIIRQNTLSLNTTADCYLLRHAQCHLQCHPSPWLSDCNYSPRTCMSGRHSSCHPPTALGRRTNETVTITPYCLITSDLGVSGYNTDSGTSLTLLSLFWGLCLLIPSPACINSLWNKRITTISQNPGWNNSHMTEITLLSQVKQHGDLNVYLGH